MLRSQWVLLTGVPGGFLLLAVAAAYGPAESDTAARAFAGLAALSLVAGGFLTLTIARRPSPPTVAAIRRFARDWVRANPGATEGEAQAALARRFAGSTGGVGWGNGAASPAGSPGDVWAGAGLVVLAVWLRHRFAPVAPARPADIDAVMNGLREEGAFEPG